MTEEQWPNQQPPKDGVVPTHAVPQDPTFLDDVLEDVKEMES